jgi:hypothetical protein
MDIIRRINKTHAVFFWETSYPIRTHNPTGAATNIIPDAYSEPHGSETNDGGLSHGMMRERYFSKGWGGRCHYSPTNPATTAFHSAPAVISIVVKAFLQGDRQMRLPPLEF